MTEPVEEYMTSRGFKRAGNGLWGKIENGKRLLFMDDHARYLCISALEAARDELSLLVTRVGHQQVTTWGEGITYSTESRIATLDRQIAAIKGTA